MGNVICTMLVQIAYEKEPRELVITAPSIAEAFVVAAFRSRNMGTHHCQSITLKNHKNVD